MDLDATLTKINIDKRRKEGKEMSMNVSFLQSQWETELITLNSSSPNTLHYRSAYRTGRAKAATDWSKQTSGKSMGNEKQNLEKGKRCVAVFLSLLIHCGHCVMGTKLTQPDISLPPFVYSAQQVDTQHNPVVNHNVKPKCCCSDGPVLTVSGDEH